MHGRGAKHGLEHKLLRVFSVTPPTSVQNSAIFAPFTKGKNHRPLFAFFLKNATFFRPKKGPRTGLSHPLTRLTAIQFSDHAKSMAQITERIFNEAPSRCRPQKSSIFRTKHTSVFLHCRMDRALRANTILSEMRYETWWKLSSNSFWAPRSSPPKLGPPVKFRILNCKQ